MSTYDKKSDAFADLKRRFPCGAEVGTRLGYTRIASNGDVKQAVVFVVAATQMWDTGKVSKPMGLVWAGRCEACDAPFYQVSQTHPDGLKEHCSFCASERYETHNYVDPNVFGQIPQQSTVKRRGRMENHVIGVTALFGDQSIVDFDALVGKAVDLLPPPKEGKRDVRRFGVIRAINSLSREKNGPLKREGGKVIFYE